MRAILPALLVLAACGSPSASDLNDDAGIDEDAGFALGDAATGAPSAAKFSEIYPLIFPTATAPRCNFCHAMMANNVSNGLLQTGEDQAAAYAALVGHDSQSSACKGKTLIVPGDPDNSLFLQKLSASPPCGSRMPLGGAPLSAAQLEMVRSWIAAGANND